MINSKKQNDMQVVKFELTEKMLAEMEQLAIKLALPTYNLSYTEIQQVLTLKSLEQLMQSYGLDVPYSLEGFLNVRHKEDRKSD